MTEIFIRLNGDNFSMHCIASKRSTRFEKSANVMITLAEGAFELCKQLGVPFEKFIMFLSGVYYLEKIEEKECKK